jgi:serpin B
MAERSSTSDLSPEAQAAIAGINAFSLDLYKQTLKPNENLFQSPASVSFDLALAYRGAVGRTAEELRQAIHYTAAPDAYLRASADVFASMNISRPGQVLQTANSIWVQDSMPLKPGYVADVEHYLGAAPQRTDFRTHPETSVADINRWVATATHDRIIGLLHESDITAETRSVLVNAIYFKGKWQAPFSAEDTKREPFARLDGAIQPTQLMHQRSHFAVVDRGGVQAIELPYGWGDVSMVVFLPHSGGLRRFETGLTDQGLRGWFDALAAAERRDTILTLPKMHLAWRQSLRGAIESMGAPIAFTSDADFSGAATIPYPGEAPGATGLRISDVIQEANIDVDEEGSEAAAATATIQVVVVSRPLHTPPPIVFRADKPFLFLLRDRRTGLILFMGRYVAPPTP